MDTIPNTAQLRKLNLLANTVKETMRMYHPLGLNIREARSDATLPVGGGPDGKDPVSVSAGQIIGMSHVGVYPPLHVQDAQIAAHKDY